MIMFGSKDNVAKIEKGNCYGEQCLANMLPLLCLGLHIFKVNDVWMENIIHSNGKPFAEI